MKQLTIALSFYCFIIKLEYYNPLYCLDYNLTLLLEKKYLASNLNPVTVTSNNLF